MRKINTLLIAILLAGFTSCSDSSTGSDSLGSGNGIFSVSGAIEKSHEGEAFYVSETSGNTVTFQIFISDVVFSIDPNTEPDAVTFSVEFRAVYSEDSFSIEEGTFQIGENSTFSGNYADLNEEGFFETLDNHGGELTITSYSNAQLDAEFEFTAIDQHEGGVVSVKGELRANCIGGQFNPNC